MKKLKSYEISGLILINSTLFNADTKKQIDVAIKMCKDEQNGFSLYYVLGKDARRIADGMIATYLEDVKALKDAKKYKDAIKSFLSSTYWRRYRWRPNIGQQQEMDEEKRDRKKLEKLEKYFNSVLLT